MDRDPAYLRLLALFHWIAAGFFALFALIPVILLATGFAFVETDAPRWFLVLFTIGWILFGTILSASLAIAGRSLSLDTGATISASPWRESCARSSPSGRCSASLRSSR